MNIANQLNQLSHEIKRITSIIKGKEEVSDFEIEKIVKASSNISKELSELYDEISYRNLFLNN